MCGNDTDALIADPAISSIDAPTASNVWKVQVEAGQTITAGQTVAILEAMKMEINVDVPPDWSEAKVERVLVQPGDVVKAGDRLALLRSG
jgi:biotin carboxyl carrier protein